MAYFSATPWQLPSEDYLWFGDTLPIDWSGGAITAGDYFWKVYNLDTTAALYRCVAASAAGITWVTVNNIDPSWLVMTTVTLTAAQILAMNGTPVSILPAPGANKAILVDQISLQMKPGGTQFAAGGAVTFQYHGTAVKPHSSTDNIAATVINSATASMNQMAPLTAAIQPPVNTGVDITNATGAFTTGNGTAIVTVWYSIVTLG